MDFTEIGLTKNESKVYKTVVKFGKSGAMTISKESGVSYSRIYDILASLEHKGLVKVIPGKGKKFIPGNPDILKKLIKERKNSLNEIEEEVDNLKKIYETKEEEPVEIARGRKNFYRLERELPKPKKLMYNIKYTVEYRPEWAREDRSYIKRKDFELKELVREDKETANNIRKWLKVHKNIRKIPNDGVAMSIIDKDAILLVLIKSNVSLLIKDKPFVALMKELIKNYYENSEKVLS